MVWTLLWEHHYLAQAAYSSYTAVSEFIQGFDLCGIKIKYIKIIKLKLYIVINCYKYS